MADETRKTTLDKQTIAGRILVIRPASRYSEALVMKLGSRLTDVQFFESVELYLDHDCKKKVDVVAIEVDPVEPSTLDGLTVLRTFFGEGPTTRIIAVSNYVLGTLPELTRQLGADLCIEKPTDPTDLAEMLEIEIHNHLIRKY